MLNIILNTLIFIICCALGYFKSQDYQCRVINLQSFLDGLKNLEDEILYRKTPLPEALKIVSDEKANNAAKNLFAKVSVDLNGKNNCSFIESWFKYTEELGESCSFTTEDMYTIKELGKVLGGTDIYGQSAVIQRAYKQIENQLEQAVQQNNTKGKMYKGLGMAIGLTIVIILL
nr:stage III sporulation protein AB [uncultured Aminipila sp.]